MKILVCDSIIIKSVSNYDCQNGQVIEYQAQTNTAANLDPVEAAVYFSTGFGVVGSVLITILVLKEIFRAILKFLNEG